MLPEDAIGEMATIRKALAVIPARMASSRFPGKPLVEFFGKPMIEHTYNAATASKLLAKVVVASDSERVLEVIERINGATVLTGACDTGTDRIVQALNRMGKEEMDEYDIVVNVQGDEPGVNAKHIDMCIDALRQDPTCVMSTLATPIVEERDAVSRDVVKCVTDSNSNAIYFSRALIPHSKSGQFDPVNVKYLRHVGLYAFRLDFLLQFPSLPRSPLELAEDLEQLRVLSAGYQIKLVEVDSTLPGVDTQEDLHLLQSRCAHRAPMSFFGYRGSSSSKSSSKESQQSELERLRAKQLSSLVRAGAHAKNHQQTTFEVAVMETHYGQLILTLVDWELKTEHAAALLTMIHSTLPTEFPLKAPTAQTSMPVNHPWLDAAGNVVGHQDLNQWTAHSDFGRIATYVVPWVPVSEIVSELRRVAATAVTPPQAASSLSPSQTPSDRQRSSSSSSSYMPYPSAGANAQPPVKPAKPEPSLQRMQIPATPAVFPELEELSHSQMQNLADDEKALKAFVKNMATVQEFMKLREEIMFGNMDIAKKTLSYQDDLRALQAEVEVLRAELRETQESLARKQIKQHQIISKFRPDALLDQVSAAAREADMASDDLAHQFAHGEVDCSQFVAQYLPLRKLYHQRTIKFNKLMQH
ncbi:TPA: hypothetical protein N0F65_005248 [Lagenidium giganteum]|uniref:3-deoxy-manno-octulosonate cytidylyltransferase n=1 Tax=Lagenidium giganteum TaxID=4803 RepID=A0AAV2YUV6_9STRA|nr:TPA: hypothetical protein N0F65_005248 [Lagenidium giganteum]